MGLSALVRRLRIETATLALVIPAGMVGLPAAALGQAAWRDVRSSSKASRKSCLAACQPSL
jgi:hypothetical protein